jgi:hypothetical protein
LQVDFVTELARKALLDGCAVVIGLQTTGEAGIDRVVSKKSIGLSGTVELNGFVSTAQQSLLNFIETLFPVTVLFLLFFVNICRHLKMCLS